ncbi:MAG: hypothetical protein Q8K70_01730 [Bacteroidota bacterium]|nr:hypothetical protein [Bacteroidota bacterium]
MKYNLIYILLISVLVSCQSKQAKIELEDYQERFDDLLFEIVPFVAKLHDSIPMSERFMPKNKNFMKTHILEREYQWQNFYRDSNYSYFQITRLEPSNNRDKYSAICGKFKQNKDGSMDSASFEEIYWTWKMKKDQLDEKSKILFLKAIKNQSLKAYCDPQTKDDWIEFPNDKVYYDKATKKWLVKE